MTPDATTQDIHWPAVRWVFPGCAPECPGHVDELTFTGVIRAVQIDGDARPPTGPWWALVSLVVGLSLLLGAILAAIVVWVWTW